VFQGEPCDAPLSTPGIPAQCAPWQVLYAFDTFMFSNLILRWVFQPGFHLSFQAWYTTVHRLVLFECPQLVHCRYTGRFFLNVQAWCTADTLVGSFLMSQAWYTADTPVWFFSNSQAQYTANTRLVLQVSGHPFG